MILDDIIEKRKIQLQREKNEFSLDKIKNMALSVSEDTRSFKKSLSGSGISIIAEVKKSSPSKSIICSDFRPVEIASEYEKSGADAVSCLTEEYYFNGSIGYLSEIRKEIKIPILRKDFIFDEYQIYHSRAAGADAILLIASILDTQTLIHFKKLASSLSLDCLFEIHDEDELKKILPAEPEIIGINNRNLKDFTISLGTTERLAPMIPDNCIIVSESGIKTNIDMKLLRSYGTDAVLIGETLMKTTDRKETIDSLRRDIL